MTLNTDFPKVIPSSRQFTAGDWPIGKYQSINGQEVRIRYGNRRTGHTLTLTYNAVSDQVASEFQYNYIQQEGTFKAWSFDPGTNPPENKLYVYAGWTEQQNTASTDLGEENPYAGIHCRWRYAEPPTITSLRPGYNNVSVKLIAVLIDVI